MVADETRLKKVAHHASRKSWKITQVIENANESEKIWQRSIKQSMKEVVDTKNVRHSKHYLELQSLSNGSSSLSDELRGLGKN